METPKAIPAAQTAEANVVKPQRTADGALPWVEDSPEPLAALTATVRLDRPVEVVHWTVVALTVFTALSVLFGAYGRSASQPRELLPIVIDAR